MRLGETRHIKQMQGWIHLYAMRSDGRKIDLFDNWEYLLPKCLDDREIVRMSSDVRTQRIHIEINW